MKIETRHVGVEGEFLRVIVRISADEAATLFRSHQIGLDWPVDGSEGGITVEMRPDLSHIEPKGD